MIEQTPSVQPKVTNKFIQELDSNEESQRIEKEIDPIWKLAATVGSTLSPQDETTMHIWDQESVD